MAVERDLTAWPIAYYFAEADERFSLPVAMPYLLDLAARGAAPGLAPGVRLRAAMLSDAIDDFAATTAARSPPVDGSDTLAILRGYARDHLVEDRLPGRPAASGLGRGDSPAQLGRLEQPHRLRVGALARPACCSRPRPAPPPELRERGDSSSKARGSRSGSGMRPASTSRPTVTPPA